MNFKIILSTVCLLGTSAFATGITGKDLHSIAGYGNSYPQPGGISKYMTNIKSFDRVISTSCAQIGDFEDRVAELGCRQKARVDMLRQLGVSEKSIEQILLAASLEADADRISANSNGEPEPLEYIARDRLSTQLMALKTEIYRITMAKDGCRPYFVDERFTAQIKDPYVSASNKETYIGNCLLDFGNELSRLKTSYMKRVPLEALSCGDVTAGYFPQLCTYQKTYVDSETGKFKVDQYEMDRELALSPEYPETIFNL